MDKQLIETGLFKYQSIRQTANKLGTSFSNLRYWIKKHDIDTSLFLIKRINHKTVESLQCKTCSKIKPKEQFYQRSRGDYITTCRLCSREKTAKTNEHMKMECVKYKGGKCEECGYDKCLGALEFHHNDPSQKEFQISSVRGYPQLNDRIRAELDKCTLLCANCHKEKHYVEYHQ